MKLNFLLSVAIVLNIASAAIIPQQPLQLSSDVEISEDDVQFSSVDDLPVINSTELQALIEHEALYSRAENLLDIAYKSNKTFGHPTRVIGSKGHWATLGYIKRELKKFGDYYNVTVQPFKAFMSDIYKVDITIDGEAPATITEMDMSPSTPNKDFVNGELTLVANDGCSIDDYPDLSGKIALVKRGMCAFGDKSAHAFSKDALAVIIYNNEEGDIRGTLGVPPEGVEFAPTVGISLKDGLKYIELLNDGKILEAAVLVDSFVGPITTMNIIAETNHGDPDNIVMLGAHSDSVSAGPGINDDGSGTISLLEVATQLTKFKVNNKVRFAWWAAEEEGLLGSNYYAENLSEEENSKIRLFMDYDMMASPNYEYEVYNANNIDNPRGSEELKNLYIDYFTSLGLNYTLIPFDGRSDYVGFIENGIPGGGIATGAEKKNVFNGDVLDKCYHQLCDDLTNIAWDAFLVNTKLIAHSVATYGESLADFPSREFTSDATVSSFRYRGDNLII